MNNFSPYGLVLCNMVLTFIDLYTLALITDTLAEFTDTLAVITDALAVIIDSLA